MNLIEATKKVLENMAVGCGGWVADIELDALRAAVEQHGERERLRDAVIEVAREVAKRFHACSFSWTETAILTSAVDALDAAERPKYEAWCDSCGVWYVGIRASYPDHNRATFFGPDAERHAREWAAMLNERKP